MQQQQQQTTAPLPTELLFHEEFKSPQTAVNIQGVTVYGNNDIFVLEPNPQTCIQTRLVIDKKTGIPKEMDFAEPLENAFDFKKSYSVFLGVVTIMEKNFLILADEVQQTCVLDNHGIFTPTSASFVPFDQDTEFFNSDKGNQLIALIMNFRRFLSQGFYFSYTYDLTISKSKRANNYSFDPKFMWNYHLYKDMIAFDISSQWYTPLIQGHVGHFKASVDKKPIKMYIISRRSWTRGSTRTYTRGLDDKGNVANHVETEQIILYDGYYSSHIQVRGNPPVFLQEVPSTMMSQIKVTRNAEFTNAAFLEHMKVMAADWNYLLCLNLMSTTKKDEQAITEVFEGLIRRNPFNRIKYEFFDYLAVTKSGKLDKINILIQKLRPMIENMGFFVLNEAERTVHLTQKGVIRTSCIDGLDRTNAIQTKIGIAVLDTFLKIHGVNLQTELTQDPIFQLDVDDNKQNHSLIIGFRDLWAANGNAICLEYSANISMATTGKSKNSFLGFLEQGMKSINNFTNSPMEEHQRQEATELLLCKHALSENSFEKVLKAALKPRQQEFMIYQELNVFIATWNVANFVPKKDYDLSDLFNFEGNVVPDMLAFGLQEYIELNASNIVVGTNQQVDVRWKELIAENLQKFGNYVLIQKETLVGILLLIFVREDYKERIRNIEVDVVKTGLAGTLGNKGCVTMKFNLDDTSLGFINCHMEAGDKQNEVRLANINDFHQKSFQQGPGKKKAEDQVANLDYIFFFGDMNFRLVSEKGDIKEMIQKYFDNCASGNEQEAAHTWTWILGEDQLLQSREHNEILDSYKEGALNFLPTYKYDVGTDTYDTSKKQRNPAWTDRILWKVNDGHADQLFYNRREDKSSDHRPVVSYFRISVKQVEVEKKQALAKEIYKQNRLEKSPPKGTQAQ